MSRRRLLSSQPPPPSFSSPHSVHRNYSNSQFAPRIFHVSADWLMLWLTRPRSFFFFFSFLLPLTSWHQALIQRRDKWETSRAEATLQQPPASPADFFFFCYFAIKQALLREIIFDNVPITSVFEWCSQQWVSCGARISVVSVATLSQKDISHLFILFMKHQKQNARKKSAERGNWKDVEAKIQNNHMTEGAERKWMSENLNETNQNQEKDHIRADDATAESKGFVSHVHLVKSIFHGSCVSHSKRANKKS